MSAISSLYFSEKVMLFWIKNHWPTVNGRCAIVNKQAGIFPPLNEDSDQSLYSSITFPHHHIVGPENRDDVGNQVAACHMVERAHVNEGG